MKGDISYELCNTPNMHVGSLTGDSLKSYEERARLAVGTEQTGKVITGGGGWYNRPERSADEIMQDLRRQYYSQPEEILNDPKGCESISFTLPDDDRVRRLAIKRAVNFLYVAADIDKYFDNEDKQSPPLPSEESRNETSDTQK
jgi:hypothetical protein